MRQAAPYPEKFKRLASAPTSSCSIAISHIMFSLSVSPFFSPLSLRHGFVVVCFEVTICELLCLDGLRHDLGDSGWGDPWFPHGAFVASLTFWYGLVILIFPLFLLPYHVKMIQCYHSCFNSPMNWHLSRLCLAVLFWVAVFCFVLVGLFLVFVFGLW